MNEGVAVRSCVGRDQSYRAGCELQRLSIRLISGDGIDYRLVNNQAESSSSVRLACMYLVSCNVMYTSRIINYVTQTPAGWVWFLVHWRFSVTYRDTSFDFKSGWWRSCGSRSCDTKPSVAHVVQSHAQRLYVRWPVDSTSTTQTLCRWQVYRSSQVQSTRQLSIRPSGIHNCLTYIKPTTQAVLS